MFTILMSVSLDFKYKQRMGKLHPKKSRTQNLSLFNLHDQMMIAEKIYWKMDRIRLGQEHYP